MVLRKVTDRRLLHRLAPAAVILLAAAAGMSATGGSWRIAPLNPAFVAYARDRAAGNLTATGAEEHGLGYIPAPVDLSHLSGQRLLTADRLSLPASFDLRATGKLTSVKDQGDCGSCWAFATYASMESNLLPGESRDFSENNMKNTHGFDWAHYDGGNHFMSTAYLTRWSGPVDEADDPYDPSSGVSPPGLPARKHVQEVIFLPDRSNYEDNDLIKQAVMIHGAVFTSMLFDHGFFNEETNAYYFDGAWFSNHAVAIVGWDDNYSRYNFTTIPSGDGAFIVKNSWGSEWGDNGYFYVSYYDHNIGHDNAVFVEAESIENYQQVYQYDPYGWVGSTYWAGTSHNWFANIFTASADEVLAAAGWYTTHLNAQYELRVYVDVTTNPTSGNLVHTQTGTIPYPGFHTINLDTPVNLSQGQKFSVVIKQGGWIAYEYPEEGYSSLATASPGQSYASDNGTTWFDFTSLHANGNVCLKAYTNKKVATPEFSPGGGSYSGPQNVTVTCATAGAEIHYTTNGAKPTIFDPVIASGSSIAVNSSIILRAKAFKEDWSASAIRTADYTISGSVGTAAAPAISPETGIYNAPQTVTITCLNSEAQIRYTLNGLDPTETSPLYEGPIEIAVTGTTLKARVYKPGWNPSPVTSATYDLVVAAPVFNPGGGFIYNTTNVIISCATPGAEIRYTMDGSEPTPASTLYQGPVAITTTTTLKSRAFRAGMTASEITTASYTMKVATPAISPNGGTYYYSPSISISCATQGASIYYTTNGDEPTQYSTIYQGSFRISNSCTIKAKAFKIGAEASEIGSAVFIMQVSAPSVNPSSGVYYSQVPVTMSCNIDGAIIRYTTDNSDPNINSTQYFGEVIKVDRSMTIKARAYKDGWLESNITEKTYTLKVNKPVLDPINAWFNESITVSASSDNPETVLRYTTNGEEPTSTSALYQGPILLTSTTILKIKGFRNGWADSDTTTGIYTMDNSGTLPQSAHPFTRDTDYTWVYRLNGDHPMLRVSFDDRTDVTNRGYIKISDGDGIDIPGSPFYNKYLAGRTVLVPGKTVIIRLVSDGNPGSLFGFQVTSIEGNQVTAPEIIPVGGVDGGYQLVRVVCSSTEAIIHYTIDGSEPTIEDPTLRSGDTIIIGQYALLKVRAYREGYLPSDVIVRRIIVDEPPGVLDPPIFSIQGGSFIANAEVAIDSFQGAEIRYTVDGSEPNENSQLYSEPILLDATTTLKARAFKAGWVASPVVTATFQKVNGVYVDANAPGPIHDGSSWNSAYLSIRDAIEMTGPGNEIWVAAGHYQSIVPKSQISLYGGFKGGETVREQRNIFRNLTKIDGESYSAVYISKPIVDFRLDGFYLYNSQNNYNSVVIYAAMVKVTISNNIIIEGIKCSGVSSDIEISGNIIYSRYNDGIKCIMSSPLIVNNLISSASRSSGISCSQAESRPVIINNTIVDKLYGITITDNAFPAIMNNIITNNQYGIYAYNGGNALLAHNFIDENQYNNYVGVTPAISDVSGSPMFSAPRVGDYRISHSSPCINSGDDLCIQEGWIDLAGNHRLLGAHVDIGAYECSIAAQPAFSPGGGFFADSPAVTITCATPDAEIRYTTDGSEPNDTSPLYTGPVTINPASTVTLKAKAFKSGWEPSPTATTIYYFKILPAPSFSLDGGVYHNDQTIAISCAMPGAVIRYTIDGSDPTEASAVYSEPLVLSDTTVLKARAFMDEWEPSPVKSASYSFVAADPYIDLAGGTYHNAQTATITCATSGAIIHYTTNGDDPTVASPVYSGPLTIDGTMTIKIRAFRTGYAPSAVVSADYHFVAADPVIGPSGGTYNNAQTVTITCATIGASIRYTTNGDEPTLASAEYTEPLNIDGNVTLKAKVFKAGYDPSATQSAVYQFVVANPVIGPSGGNFDNAQTVTVTCATSGAAIHYTLDGHDPTVFSPVYTGPITIDGNATLKVRAFKAGYTESAVRSAAFSFIAATPGISPDSGTYGAEQTVTLTCATAGAVIRYTLDGSDPTAFSPAYEGPFTLAPVEYITLKAVAFKDGYTASEIAAASYHFLIVAAPSLSPDGGTFANGQPVSITCATPDAVIRYTLDGSDPTSESPVYGEPIIVDGNTTLKAKAFKEGWIPSGVACGTYSFVAATPAFSPEGGAFENTQVVTATCATSGAAIRYTLDGTDPTALSLEYTGPISVDGNTVLKARAFKAGYTESAVLSATFSFTAAMPAISLAEGTFDNAQTAEITCATIGASIRYTTDGSEPSPTSAEYTGPLTIDRSMTLKVKAFKTGYDPSATRSATYGFAVAEPSLSSPGGTFENAQTVTVACATEGAIIRYTLDGHDPTSLSPAYTGPVTIDGNATLKVRAFKAGYTESPVRCATFSFIAATPGISPDSGTYGTEQIVTLTCATAGATIYYTLDGSEPSMSSLRYDAPFALIPAADITLKAKAFKDGYEASGTASVAYHFLIVATPCLSPDGGILAEGQTVSITCATPGATIHYTLDGSDPTVMSPVYDGPIPVVGNVTLKAKAFKEGWIASEVASGAYGLLVAMPVFSINGGAFTNAQTITISCTTIGATIRYTLDGHDPTELSPEYNGPITIDASATLKARAFKAGYIESAVRSATFSFTAAAPAISPAGGTYNNAQPVTIACATIGASIRYTTNGDEPTLASAEYTEPLSIDGNATLKAKAFKDGYDPSAAVSAVFTFTAADPVFSLNGGAFTNAQTITISCTTIGATIRYTLDGHEPTELSPEYNGPITIDASATLKARAFKAGYIESAVRSAAFSFTAADPVISPNGGTFSEPQTVTIGCGTAGAMVRYTVDGTDPTDTSPEYVGPFIVEAGATVKARAFKTGYAASGITVADFSFVVAAPVFSPGGGTYHAAQEVSLNCATAGAVIRYTTDGSEPTSTSDEYTGPITIDANTVLKAKAFRAGWAASPTATASYIFKAPTPTVNPPGGTYNTPLAVTASCAVAGAVIRYTTDGTEPTDSSPIHTGPIPVETAAFLKFKAFKPGWDAGETLAVNYTILSRRLSFQPGDGGAYSTLKTAQAWRDDPYTQWQGRTLALGRGASGRPSDLWLWFPQIMGGNAGQVPGTGKIIQAKLVLRLAEIAGDPSRPYRLKIYRITDPDGRGAPAFGTADGLRTGLDFMYRDHRLGMNVRWADGAENILALFADTQPLDAIEFIPAELAAQGIDAIQLDVTAAVQAWMDGAPNQGWFVCLDGEWAAGQMLAFHGAAATVQALRPYLEVLYTPAGGDVEPPAAAVGSLSAVTGPGSVALAWINPAADPDFSGVKIVRKPGIVPFDPYDGDLVYDGPGEACADYGLVDGKPYYYAAFAYDGLRNYGPKAWILAVPGTPAAPVLNAAAGAGYVQLTWNTVDGADRYRVYRRGGSGARLIKEVSAPSHVDFNVRMQPYDYWVTAVKDGCGEGQPSNIVTAAPAPASWTPAAPANLAATAVSNTEIRLTWEDLSDNEVAFALERKRDGEEIWMPVAAPAFNTESFVDANLDPGTTYVYRLKAISWDRESGWVESNPAATGNAPLAPANLTWTVISAGRVNLAWTDRAANETGYRVHVAGGDGSAWTLELPAEAEFCSVTGLRAGVAYRFRVEAWNLDGGSMVESETVMTALDPKDGLL